MKQGKTIVFIRRITLSLIFVAVLASLAFDSGIGTPSAFGINEFFLLCPLGGVEAMLASKSFLPAAAISLLVVVFFVLIFGRAWCAWGCPAPVIRGFFRRQPKSNQISEEGSTASILTHISQDKRLWVLAAVLLITLIVGFPIFCLVCPIGLTFGTVGSLWHLLVDKQITASVIVFPLALMAELILYRKWCVNFCPIGGLFGILGRAAKLFRPRVKASSCLRYSSEKKCNICTTVCAENINLHTVDAPHSLGECTRCGECVKHCPTQSIAIEVKPGDPVIRN